VVGASETDLTPVAGVALWGPLLDRLNVVAEADRRELRRIGPRTISGMTAFWANQDNGGTRPWHPRNGRWVPSQQQA
jgi:hypothetical protein